MDRMEMREKIDVEDIIERSSWFKSSTWSSSMVSKFTISHHRRPGVLSYWMSITLLDTGRYSVDVRLGDKHKRVGHQRAFDFVAEAVNYAYSVVIDHYNSGGVVEEGISNRDVEIANSIGRKGNQNE